MVSDNSSVRKAHGNANKPALVITDYTGWRSLLNPLWCYNGFRMAVVGLTCFGLIMVFSSSTVTMAAQGRSPIAQSGSVLHPWPDCGIFCHGDAGRVLETHRSAADALLDTRTGVDLHTVGY